MFKPPAYGNINYTRDRAWLGSNVYLCCRIDVSVEQMLLDDALWLGSACLVMDIVDDAIAVLHAEISDYEQRSKI